MANLLTKDQAAEVLAIGVRTLERLMSEKKLPYVKVVRGSVRFRPQDLEAFIERRMVNKKAIA